MRRIFVIICCATLLSLALFWLIDYVGMMPLAASYEADFIDRAFQGMVYLTVPIFSLVVATLFYCLWTFRVKDGCPMEEGVRFYGSKGALVETLWILISLVLTLGLAAYGSMELRTIRGQPQADLDIQVDASQWSWEFFYPAYNQYGSRLLLPRGKRVRLLLTAKDVVHSFWVPEFRVKQDALPGKIVQLLFTPSKTGTYQLLCAELCGTDHTTMTAFVEVVEPEEFEEKMKGEAW